MTTICGSARDTTGEQCELPVGRNGFHDGPCDWSPDRARWEREHGWTVLLTNEAVQAAYDAASATTPTEMQRIQVALGAFLRFHTTDGRVALMETVAEALMEQRDA